MPNKLTLNGLYVGQEQSEVFDLYPDLKEEGWDREFAVFQQGFGPRIVLKDGRVHSVLEGTELREDDRRILCEGMSLERVLKNLGDPHRKRVGEYYSGQLDEADRPVPHPDSPGIVLLLYRQYGHEIQIGCYRGPAVCSIGIRCL